MIRYSWHLGHIHDLIPLTPRTLIHDLIPLTPRTLIHDLIPLTPRTYIHDLIPLTPRTHIHDLIHLTPRTHILLGVRGIKSCISVLGVRGIKSCICVLGVRGIKSCICVLGVRGINFTFVTTIFLFICWNCSDSKLFFIFHFISMFTFYSDQKSNYFNNYPIFGKNEFTTFFLYKCDAVIDAIAHLLDPKQNLSKKLVF
jgi:hypothetical protein